MNNNAELTRASSSGSAVLGRNRRRWPGLLFPKAAARRFDQLGGARRDMLGASRRAGERVCKSCAMREVARAWRAHKFEGIQAKTTHAYNMRNMQTKGIQHACAVRKMHTCLACLPCAVQNYGEEKDLLWVI